MKKITGILFLSLALLIACSHNPAKEGIGSAKKNNSELYKLFDRSVQYLYSKSTYEVIEDQNREGQGMYVAQLKSAQNTSFHMLTFEKTKEACKADTTESELYLLPTPNGTSGNSYSLKFCASQGGFLLTSTTNQNEKGINHRVDLIDLAQIIQYEMIFPAGLSVEQKSILRNFLKSAGERKLADISSCHSYIPADKSILSIRALFKHYATLVSASHVKTQCAPEDVKIRFCEIHFDLAKSTEKAKIYPAAAGFRYEVTGASLYAAPTNLSCL